MLINHSDIDLYLFDLDGTILDTAKEFHLSLNVLLQKKELIEKEFSSVRQIVSEGAGALISLGFSISDNDANFEILRKELIEEYEKICTDSKTFGGFEELIRFIKDNNKKWGIVTNKPKFLTDKISNFYKWDEMADIVISPEDVENRRKPDPSGINLAMKKLNCSPENTLFFGDHFKDFEASKIIITRDPQYPSLKLYPKKTWDYISSNLISLQTLDPIVRKLQWTILGNASVINFDLNNRMNALISSDLREYAELSNEKKVVLIGMGDKFEIWNSENWDARQTSSALSSEILEIVLPESVKNLSF